MISKSEILFSKQWVNGQSFETSLQSAVDPHANDVSDVVFQIGYGCKIMVDTSLRLLSLANQLCYVGKNVTLDFEEGEDGAMGYLNRIGFLDYVDPRVTVLPCKPQESSAAIFRGKNIRLVEIERINPFSVDRNLPSRLADSLEEAVILRADHKSLSFAAFTVLSELIDNIFQHSSTELDGYAVLQVYKRGVTVAVSDSGKGIIRTLRPSLKSEFPRLRNVSDTALIVEAFRSGLSRYGRERGCGLKRSAEQAIKYNATLDVRLPTCLVHLEPSTDGYAPSMAYCYENIPLIWGTHICFDFQLDN
jgi:hypothetical protein